MRLEQLELFNNHPRITQEIIDKLTTEELEDLSALPDTTGDILLRILVLFSQHHAEDIDNISPECYDELVELCPNLSQVSVDILGDLSTTIVMNIRFRQMMIYRRQ